MKVWPFGATAKVEFLRSAQETIHRLQAVGRAGTAKGVESLGKLTQKTVAIAATGVSLIPTRSLPAALAPYEAAAVLASMPFERDATGFGALAFGSKEAMRLVDLLIGKGLGTTKNFGDLESSAIAETANISVNAMITAVASAAGASIKTGVPETQFDARARLRELMKVAGQNDHAILLETEFSEKASSVAGRALLVFFTRAAPKGE